MGHGHSSPISKLIRKIENIGITGFHDVENIGKTGFNDAKNLFRKNHSNNPNSCNYQLNDTQKKCYLDRYPDVQHQYGSNNLAGAQTHWSNVGCNQGRSNDCPSPQSISGSYTFQGCYNDNGNRAIPNFMGNVGSVDQCRQVAEKTKSNIFGVQYYGQCFVGDNKTNAEKYGLNVNGNSCGPMGKAWTNQVYIKNDPIVQPLPPIPQLSSPNFSKETFANKSYKSDQLNKGTDNLYNQLFCDIYPSNNGFNTCTDCTLDSSKVYKTVTATTTQDCQTSCKNDERCTSYVHDISVPKDNCTQYISFPTKLNKGVSKKNSGYKLSYPYDYNSLSQEQKNNVKKRCSNQYLNNTFNTDINYNKCLKMSDKSQDLTALNIDAKCLYNLYDAGKQHVGAKELNNYKDDSELFFSQGDPVIDSYKSNYDNYTTKQVQNSNINNKLSKTDSTYSKYNDTVSHHNNLNDKKFTQTLTDLKDNHTEKTKSIIAVIETFENDNKNNNIYLLILILIIIFIIIIYSYGYRK